MIGQNISHYHVVEKLGEGGMGVVYRARDIVLERDVALKFLPRALNSDEHAKSRFIHEAKTASALDHPNVCYIHEIGETESGQLYIAMAYYSGESLSAKLRSGPLRIDDVVDIMAQAARGLARAHEHGIIHRDVKPANLLLTDEGVVKVLDFGVAKMSSATALTRTGSSVGTTLYMSPEQARGETVDHRSDIWSLGATSYEMLSGRRPFRGEYEPAVVYSILNEDPVRLSSLRPEVSPELEQIIDRALAKDVDRRFQSLGELLDALADLGDSSRSAAVSFHPTIRLGRKHRTGLVRVASVLLLFVAFMALGRSLDWWEGQSVTRVPSLVVLPFENLGRADDVYFASGMTAEITSKLAAASGLQVVSRRSAQQYEGSTADNATIGAELGVNYILSGSVHWVEDGSNRVRITPELIRIADDVQLWSNFYDEVIDNILAVQSDISEEVIRQLGITLIEQEQASISARPTENVEAYRLYLQGRYFWERRTKENINRARSYYEQAIELDPSYARAYVGIAETWIFNGWYSRLAPGEAFPRAVAAVERALEFDPLLSEAHTARAHLYLEYDHDWEAAERAYRKAIELDPKYAQARHWYGGYLSAMGRHDEAMQQALAARDLDPLSMIIRTWVGLRHYFAGRHHEAIAEYQSVLEFNANFAPGHWHLSWALEEVGLFEDAIGHAKRALEISEGNLLYLTSLGRSYALAGREAEARDVLNRLKYEAVDRHVSAYHVSVIFAALGEIDDAFDWLERAFDERSPWIGYMRVDPRLQPLRSDARFEASLIRAGLTS